MSRYDRILNFRYFILQAMFWGAAVVYYAYMTQILENKGFTDVEIGILNGVKLLVGIAFQVWIGVFSDKHVYTVPLKLIIAALSVASAILSVGLYFTGHNFALMLLISVGSGMAFTTINPLVDSLSILYINHRENINYAVGRTGGSFAWAFLCLAAGWYCDFFGLKSLPVWGIFFLMILGIVAATMPWKKIKIENFISVKRRETGAQPHSVLYLLKNYPVYTVFLLGSAVMFMAYNLGSTFLIDVFTGLGGDNSDYGMSQFILAISEVPAAFVVIRIKNKVPVKWMMLCCTVFMTIKFIVPCYTTSVNIIIAVQACEMLGLGLFYASSMYFISQMLPEADIVKGTTMLSVATVGFGEGVASLLCGVIRHQIGLYGLMKTSAAVSAVSILIMLIMCRMDKKDLLYKGV